MLYAWPLTLHDLKPNKALKNEYASNLACKCNAYGFSTSTISILKHIRTDTIDITELLELSSSTMTSVATTAIATTATPTNMSVTDVATATDPQPTETPDINTQLTETIP